MEIVMKNYEILNKIEALRELSQLILPMKTSWNITKNIKKFEASIRTYSECEYELVKRYAIKDENGNVKFDDKGQPKFPPNNLEKYYKERQELLDCEDTLDILNIKLSDLENVDIKPATLMNLDFMIVDDSE
jgi:hypothetical protein